jgi:hypothetical protein
MAPMKRNGPAKNDKTFSTYREKDGAVTLYRKDKAGQAQESKNIQRQGYSKRVGDENAAFFDGMRNSSRAKVVKDFKKDGDITNADFVRRSKENAKQELKKDTMDNKPSKGYPDKPFMKHTTKGKQ